MSFDYVGEFMIWIMFVMLVVVFVVGFWVLIFGVRKVICCFSDWLNIDVIFVELMVD